MENKNIKEYITEQLNIAQNKMLKDELTPDVWNTTGIKFRKWEESNDGIFISSKLF